MIVRKLICLGAALIMSISLFCACSGGNDMQKRLDDLQRKLEQQSDRLEELEDKNKSLKDKVTDLQDELEEKNSGLVAQADAGDFSLKLTIDKNTASVGDSIKISVEFMNLSGKDIPVVYWANESSNILRIFDSRFYVERQEPIWALAYPTKHRDTLKKDAELSHIQDYKIEELKNYEVYAEAVFYIGEESSKENRICFKTKAITINVSGGKESGLVAIASTEDFSLKLTIDKNTASVGDRIKILIELTNLSGKDIPIVYWANTESTYNILHSFLYPQNEEPDWPAVFTGEYNKVIGKGEKVVLETDYYTIKERKDYEIYASAGFFIGYEARWQTWENWISFSTGALKINVI